MGHVSVFLAALAGCTGVALVYGGAPERSVALIYLLGAAASWAALRPIDERYAGLEVGVFLVDLVMFGGLMAVALKSRRYWPLWITAMQFLQVTSHFTKIMPEVIRLAYGIIVSFWAYPMLIILAAGTVRHRIRASTGGDEGSWRSGIRVE